MEERIASSPSPRTAAEYRAAIDELLAEMKRMNQQSDRTRADIEQLKAESAAIRAETEIIKTRLDRRLEALAKLL
jgi:peptidoglycan hydrolase CwlO-like protein